MLTFRSISRGAGLEQRFVRQGKPSRRHHVIDAHAGLFFQQNRHAKVHVDELAEQFVDPRDARLVRVPNVALSTARPAVAVGHAFEHREKALDLRAKPIDFVEVAVRVAVEPLDEVRERLVVAALLVAEPALLDRNDGLDAAFDEFINAGFRQICVVTEQILERKRLHGFVNERQQVVVVVRASPVDAAELHRHERAFPLPPFRRVYDEVTVPHAEWDGDWNELFGGFIPTTILLTIGALGWTFEALCVEMATGQGLWP